MLLRSVAVAIVLAIPALAHADMGMLPGDDVVTFNTQKVWFHESPCTGVCSAVEDPTLSNQDQCLGGSGNCGGNQSLALPLNSVTTPLYALNYAHCSCSRVSATAGVDSFYDTSFAVELDFTGTTPSTKSLDVWVGTGCDDPVARQNTDAGMCHQITNPAPTLSITGLMTDKFARPEVPFYDLVEATPTQQMAGICESTIQGGTVSIFAMGAINTSTYDYSVSTPITIDTQPPPLPDSFTAEGAESAIQISWTPPSAGTLDVYAYQALCEQVDANGNETPTRTSAPAAKYQTAHMLCGVGDDPVPTATTLDTPSATGVDAGITSPGALMSHFDPKFICGEKDDATATSMRIEGLKDGQEYTVMFVVVDHSGNLAATYFTSPLKPKPAKDFWQDLHDQGSGVEGGFCLFNDTYGGDSGISSSMRGFRDGTLASTAFGRWVTRAYYRYVAPLGALVHGHLALRLVAGALLLPVIAFALLWQLLTLPGLFGLVALLYLARRRHWSVAHLRRLLGPRTAAVLVLLVPWLAHAQAPYWETDRTGTSETESLADSPDDVAWHVGIRLGPYTPQIDAQLGKSPGPYSEMFGTKASWTPMLDVDRMLWTGFGQLGVGLSAGYMSKSAHAWAVCTPDDIGCIDTPGDPNRTRSTGDENSFHLLPLAATAIYRLTYLDDEYGVPVVPYARGGLGYYVWWSDGPDGNAATSMLPGSMATTTAKGASLGLVGSIGLAIRAERIDADAARSMRESGLQHAGFFAEYSDAWVNGFGSSKKLSVGDHTWFAGVDFEF